MIEPVHAAPLNVRERIGLRRARQFVLGEHCLFLPGVQLLRRYRRWLTGRPVAAFDGLTTVSPGGDAPCIDDLALHMEAADEERVSTVLQELKNRARVLAHQN